MNLLTPSIFNDGFFKSFFLFEKVLEKVFAIEMLAISKG